MVQSALELTASHLLATKYFQIAAYTMFLYDHALTFGIEVEKIWKRPLSVVTGLFLINRYGTLVLYIAIVNAFHDPRWTKELCDRYSVFEGAGSVAIVGVCELIMILRVYALYGSSKSVLTFLMTLWTVQIVMSAVGLSTGYAIPLPEGLVGCIYTGTNKLFPCLWVTPLATDTIIFLMTFWRGRQHLFRFHHNGSPKTNHVFIRDGAFYFFVIFLSNFANTMIFFGTTSADLKPIAASFNQLLTSTVISRLVLNLRSVGGLTTQEDTDLSQDIRFRASMSHFPIPMKTLDSEQAYHEVPPGRRGGVGGTALSISSSSRPRPSVATLQR